MKKVLVLVVAACAALSLTAPAGAVPATENTQKAISVLEGQDQGASKPKPPRRPVKRKKVRKPAGPVRQHPAPAPSGASEAPAAPAK